MPPASPAFRPPLIEDLWGNAWFQLRRSRHLLKGNHLALLALEVPPRSAAPTARQVVSDDGTLERTMRRTSKRVNLESDIKPVSEFRANAAGLIDHVRSSGRPLVLTQRGHSAAVLLDVSEYERLLTEIELFRDVREAEDQIASGSVLTHRDARAELRRRLKK